MEEYVVVETFINEVEAELAQATLAAAGIESFLKYEDIGGMLPPLQESGGVRVLVRPSNLEEAKALLSQQATPEE
jgi:hypothetical protein